MTCRSTKAESSAGAPGTLASLRKDSSSAPAVATALSKRDHFVRHVAFAQLVLGDLQRRVRDQMRPADRDAAGDGLAVQA